MARKRDKKRQTSKRSTKGSRALRHGVWTCWIIVAVIWGLSIWDLYSTFVRKVHFHFFDSLAIIDVFFLALAIWMTVEWRRTRSARGSGRS